MTSSATALLLGSSCVIVSFCIPIQVHGQERAASQSLGKYVVYESGKLVARTRREDDVATRTTPARAGAQRTIHDLAHVTAISEGCGVYVSLGDDEGASVADFLDAVERFDPKCVWGMLIVPRVDLDSLQRISRYKHLEHLRLTHCSAIDSREGAKVLTRLPNLRLLSLAKGGDAQFGSPELCQALHACRELQFLQMPCEALQDADFKAIANHPRLESICFGATKPVCGREAFTAFGRMKQLRELTIPCRSDVTADDILAFSDLPKLESLTISTPAKVEAKAEFKRRRPDCHLSVLEEFFNP